MNIFGLEIKRKQRVSGTSAQETGVQLRPTDGQGPYTKYFSQFVPRKHDPKFFEFLVESIPVCAAAIKKLTTLDGVPIITGNNEKLVEEIKEWMQHVPVNDMQKGLQAFHQGLSREAFEQGFGLGEYITNKQRNDIIGLRVGDSKYIKFSRDETGMRIYQKSDNDLMERELNQENLMYFSIDNENQNPYGTPTLRGCEFVTKIMTTIYNATMNNWERFGDPSYSVIYKTSKKDGTDLAERRKAIADELDAAVRAKRQGKSADFVRAIDINSELSLSIIGADGQLLDMQVPMQQIVQDICGVTGLPAWMLGYSFSTTERRANFEAEMVLADVAVRQEAKTPHFERLITTMLRLRGRTWKTGDWQLEWKQVNLHDIVAQAQAGFLNAQAEMMKGQALPTEKKPPQAPSAPPKKSACGCDHDHIPGVTKMVHGNKETRPFPWPELDQVESGYETRLKSDWQDFAVKLFTICGLDPASIALGFSKAPGDEAFTFSEEQRAQILKEMESLIGTYHFDDPDSPLLMYYGESYSLGLIQAAHLVGETRPILDIIKNREIYDELVANGFHLLKDNITRAIQDRIVAEMEAHTIAGTNPLNVAERLNKLFGDQNSSWERLARTEMAAAAERAKTDEWKAWKVEKVDFVPAPDACPICTALQGEYKIEECPVIPVHPRCRCSKRPAKSETA